MVNPVDLPKSLLPQLHAYIAETCNNHNSPAIIVGGTQDHVHILCHLSKNISISKLLEEIKRMNNAVAFQYDDDRASINLPDDKQALKKIKMLVEQKKKLKPTKK